MNGFHLQIFLAVGGVFAAAGLLLLSALTFRYRVTPTDVLVTWLGLPVRRLRLTDIKRVGTRPVLWAERWPNSWDRGRVLVIRRHTGLFRNFLITPKFPFEFRNKIEQARKVQLGLAFSPAAAASEVSPSQVGSERAA